MLIPTHAPGGSWEAAGWAVGLAVLQGSVLCPSRYTCPFVEKFSIEIETYYRPDAGQQTNIFNLSVAEKRQRILGGYGWPGELGRILWLLGFPHSAPGMGVWMRWGLRGSTSLSLLVLMVWGCQKGRAPWILSSLPQAPCDPGSLLQAPCLFPLRGAELSFTLKIFSGIVLSSASSLASISVCSFSFLVPVCSPLLLCPRPVPAWICLLSLSWCTWDPKPGSYGVFRISWSRESWK